MSESINLNNGLQKRKMDLGNISEVELIYKIAGMWNYCLYARFYSLFSLTQLVKKIEKFSTLPKLNNVSGRGIS